MTCIGRTRKAGAVEFTGERYVPELDEPEISFEHWHRYLWSVPLCAGKRVLDVACGEGYGAAILAETAAHVTGVDSDAAAIAHAQEAYPGLNLDFIRGCAQDLPFSNEDAFDVVISYETIEHLAEEDQRRFLDEVRRVLTPGGIAVFSTPNRAVYTDRPHYHNPFHLKEFYLNEFRTVLGRSFTHVRLLGQRMFGASYLWPLDTGAGSLREYQLDYESGAFIPTSRDQKEALYVVALCSDRPIEECDRSILLDAADRMMTERRLSATHAQTIAQQAEALHAMQEEMTRLQQQAAAALQTAQEHMTLVQQQHAEALQAMEARTRVLEEQAAAARETIADQEAHIAMLSERHRFLTARETEARRLLTAVHEQLTLRDADYRTLLGNFEQQRRDLMRVQDERAYLSSELNAVAAERIVMADRMAEFERDWHNKNAYIETLETALRTAPFATPLFFTLRAIRRLQRLIHA